MAIRTSTSSRSPLTRRRLYPFGSPRRRLEIAVPACATTIERAEAGVLRPRVAGVADVQVAAEAEVDPAGRGHAQRLRAAPDDAVSCGRAAA